MRSFMGKDSSTVRQSVQGGGTSILLVIPNTPTMGKMPMSRTLLTSILLAVFCHAFASVHAQHPDPDSTGAYHINPVVVTAFRQERDVAAIPANVTVITADEIAVMPVSQVSDVLRYSAGIEVADIGGNGRTTAVDIRGFGERADANTLVLVDGRRINSADLGGIDWTTIPLSLIERIEIIRGGQSVVFGDKAVGGVINIVTRKGALGRDVTLSGSVGNHGRAEETIHINGRAGDIGYSVHQGHLETNGYRSNSFFRNDTTFVGIDRVGETVSLALSAGTKDDRYGLAGSLPATANRRSSTNPYDRGESESRYLHAVPSLRLGADHEVSLGFDLREGEQQSRFVSFGVAQLSSDLREYRIAPKLRSRWMAGVLPAELTIGCDLDGTEYESEFSSAFGASLLDVDRAATAVYASNQIFLIPDVLSLDTGYRRDRIAYEFSTASDAHYDVDASLIGLTWNYAPGTRVFLSFDRSYRTQLAEEFGGPFGAATALKPQLSKQIQAGISCSPSRATQYGITAFQIRSDNEMIFDPNFDPSSPFGGQNVNVDRINRSGIELTAAHRINSYMRAFGNYTWSDHEFVGGRYDENRIPGVSRQYGHLGVTILPNQPVTLDIRSRWRGSQVMPGDWDNVVDWDDSYWVTDAKIAYQRGNFTVFCQVNNVFNQLYAETAGFTPGGGAKIYPSPERAGMVGFKYVHHF